MAEDLGAVDRLTYEEAKQALTSQASALDALRSRAGTLLQVTSLATAFLGGLIFKDGLPDGWAVLVGIFAFLGVVPLSLSLLVPLPGWRFTASPKAIVRDFIETDSSANLMETHRELALRFGKWLDRNQKRLNALYVIFAGASALLALQVGAWLLALTKGYAHAAHTTPISPKTESDTLFRSDFGGWCSVAVARPGRPARRR